MELAAVRLILLLISNKLLKKKKKGLGSTDSSTDVFPVSTDSSTVVFPVSAVTRGAFKQLQLAAKRV